MNITIKINTDNAAFSESANEELARILEQCAKNLRQVWNEVYTGDLHTLFDVNGNNVGTFTVKR